MPMTRVTAVGPTPKNVSVVSGHARADRRRGGVHAPVDYRAFVQPPKSWINWSASLLLLVLLCFTTSINVLYLLKYQNVVSVDFPDLFATDKEWLFGKEHTGAINLTLVHDFIYSDSLLAVTRLKSALLSTRAGGVDASTPCVAVVGHDAGSLYAFCDRYDASQLPEWAQSFDALIIQTIYLATVEQHRLKHRATPYLGIVQGFRNNRTGWYKQESLHRLYCTTKQLAEASKEPPTTRVLFTKAHGVLRNVDCALPTEASTAACDVIRDRKPFVLFEDGTGILNDFEVVRTEGGTDLILGPFSSNGRIGQRTDFEYIWPMDDCLYVRGDSIGWFGAGKSSYHVNIPMLALAAKLQLVGMLLVIWRIKFECALYRAHHAMHELSRLGAFAFLVGQLLLSAYYEQDIMRTMFAWQRKTISDWCLFQYIESTIALASALLALSLLRIVFQSSMCQLGVSLTMLLPMVIGLAEISVAQLNYSSYTVDNGLLAEASPECGAGQVSCASGKLNHLHFVFVLSTLPMLIEWLQRLQNRYRRFRTTLVSVLATSQLTTFEKICLDQCSIHEVVLDCGDAYVDIQSVRHVSATLVSACGFTLIKNRFLVRTKDLGLVLAACILPRAMLRDITMVVWPLDLRDDGTMYVTVARRVFIRNLHDVALKRLMAKEQSSLLVSDEHPLS